MKILFVAGFGPVVQDEMVEETARFYQDALGIDFEKDGAYWHTGHLDGVKHLSGRCLKQPSPVLAHPNGPPIFRSPAHG